MANLPQEQLRVVLLDRRGRLIDTPLIYQGGQTETAVRLADCFRDAVRRRRRTCPRPLPSIRRPARRRQTTCS